MLQTIKSDLGSVDVVILCGGQGTRFRPVFNDIPKALAPFGEKIYLDILIGYLGRFGFKRIILGIGHLRDQIMKHVLANKKLRLEIIFSEENVPLGTGGALRNAARHVKSENFLAMNGDIFINLDFALFHEHHLNNNSIFTMALSEVDDVSDYGSVELGENSRVLKFKEKQIGGGKGYINAGVYMMKKDIFRLMPSKEIFSLEQDFFPLLPGENFYGFVHKGHFIDIGTPERYWQALKIFESIF